MKTTRRLSKLTSSIRWIKSHMSQAVIPPKWNGPMSATAACLPMTAIAPLSK